MTESRVTNNVLDARWDPVLECIIATAHVLHTCTLRSRTRLVGLESWTLVCHPVPALGMIICCPLMPAAWSNPNLTSMVIADCSQQFNWCCLPSVGQCSLLLPSLGAMSPAVTYAGVPRIQEGRLQATVDRDHHQLGWVIHRGSRDVLGVVQVTPYGLCPEQSLRAARSCVAQSPDWLSAGVTRSLALGVAVGIFSSICKPSQ